MAKNKVRWKKYLLEFLSVFIGVTLAFSLTKWNEDRRFERAELKILAEIRVGLQLDLEDIRINVLGHEKGLEACNYFRGLVNDSVYATDSVGMHYHYLLRDFISIQNSAGYESLKSNGLDLVSNDSLRHQIISMYDLQFEIIEKLEEQYSETQFYKNYVSAFTEYVSPNMMFDDKSRLARITQPLGLDVIARNELLSYLSRIEMNRGFCLRAYADTETMIRDLIRSIDRELYMRR